MPRKRINIAHHVEYLSVLDEKGKLDEKLEPRMPEELLLKLHRGLLLGRKFDQRLLNLQRQGRIGTFAPITGQEASQVGAVAALRASDWFVPSFRETAAELWRGRTMESVVLSFAGFSEGAKSTAKLNNLPVAVPVASQVVHAVGLAWAIRYRQKDDVAMTFFGDGATSEGDFHEGLNLAALFQLPAIFVCQNNHWAISVPRAKQTHSKTLAQKAVAYDMPGIQVDGNDVLAVYAAAQEAVERARSGGGPTLIECVTYRMMMHTTADDPKRYRTDKEVDTWKKRDPIPRFQAYLEGKGILSAEKIKELEEEINAEIQAAVEGAEKQMKEAGNPADMFDHTYAELSPVLMEQREELMQELAAIKEDSHG